MMAAFDILAAAKSRFVPVAAFRNYLSGLIMSAAGSSFSVDVGVACDSTNVDVLTLASLISKTTSAWAVGSTNGGLDTGTIAANTWYHVFLIKRPDAGVVDVLVSLSATAPTLPTSYTLFRRIGAMRTNASSQWTPFSQNGDEFLWLTPLNDVNTNALGTAASLFTLTVPTGLNVNALISGLIFKSAAGAFVLISSPNAADVAPVSNSIFTTSQTQTNNYGPFIENVRTNFAGQIRARSDSASVSLFITTKGYIDRRGRDG
jgi:hypothetical protein